MDFSNYKFRCSGLGYIMSNPKGKSNLEKYNDILVAYDKCIDDLSKFKNAETKSALNAYEKMCRTERKRDWLKERVDTLHLSDSCKTHLCDVYTVAKYGRTEDIKSKYFEKGLHMEEDAITAYSILTGKFFSKNPKKISNDFMEGTFDFSDEECIYDTKCNWSIFQFNRIASKPIKDLYRWQLWAYMWLSGKEKAKLIYCLLNTPEHLVSIEEKRLLYDFFGTEEQFNEAVKELRFLHTYEDIPLDEKVRVFELEFDESLIPVVEKRIKDCRIYLNNLNNKKIQDEDSDETED